MDAFERGDYREALAICELWRTGMPGDPGPLFSMARVYRSTGETDRAIAVMRRSLR